MTKNDVLSHLCAITSSVMRERFGYQESADCFCGSQTRHDPVNGFQFSTKVLEFVESAVKKALEEVTK